MLTEAQRSRRNALDRETRRTQRERLERRRRRHREYMRKRRSVEAAFRLHADRKRHETWRCPVCGMLRRIASFNFGVAKAPDGQPTGHRLERRFVSYPGAGFEWSDAEPLTVAQLEVLGVYVEAALARIDAELASRRIRVVEVVRPRMTHLMRPLVQQVMRPLVQQVMRPPVQQVLRPDTTHLLRPVVRDV